MLQMKDLSEVRDLKVYTDSGDFFGEIEEAIIKRNRIDAWKVRSAKDSFLSKTMPNAKGVIIPHQLVKSIGNIMIVARAAAPSYGESVE
jgi:sporulation protein YlmC with PRC-barrel domain